ncbi:hypothetical protein ACLB2K_037144 [Fragaria x ananassa]
MASERTEGDAFSSYLPGWSNLPGGPASLILDELFELVDFVHFAVFCKEWCSLAKHYYHTTRRWRPNKGDLWHIPRFRSNKTQSFKVFKVVLIETGRNLGMRQVEVKSIGDEALFLGYNSISVLASETSGCQPNTIYQQIEAAKPVLWVTPPFNSANLSLCA